MVTSSDVLFGGGNPWNLPPQSEAPAPPTLTSRTAGRTALKSTMLHRLLPHLSPATPAVWGGLRRLGVAREPARSARRALQLHTCLTAHTDTAQDVAVKMPSRKKGIPLHDAMTIGELSSVLNMRAEILRTKLQELRVKVPKSGGLSLADSERLVRSVGLAPNFIRIVSPFPREDSTLMPRPPVVAVMGHVDHGKTTLLDSLRQTAVAASEAGGITQHIGAFSVTLRSGACLTFLDTPGHAAFSNMRARGADATDMVVLVVAADDGVKEQTKESIRMIQNAKVPMVVAINKCDKHKKDIGRLKRELLEVGVQLEELGGEVQAVEISALKQQGLPALEEALLAQAELCQIRGALGGPVQGVVIESRVDKGMGCTATVVVQHGTLQVGDVLVAGETWCKVKSMHNEKGGKTRSAPPSSPVLTTGWKELPMAGELCLQASSEQEAKTSCAEFSAIANTRNSPHLRSPSHPDLDASDDDVITVPLVVKGDVAGSVEALLNILTARQPLRFRLKVVHSGVGPISESDMDMAISTKAFVLAFGVPCPKSLISLAKSRDISILSNNVIYRLLDMLKGELEPMLEKVDQDEVLGSAHVIKVFDMKGSKPFTVGGCMVDDGKMKRTALFRVIRRDKVVHESTMREMKMEKVVVEKVGKGDIVGLRMDENFPFQEGDKVQCYKVTQVSQPLQWDLGF